MTFMRTTLTLEPDVERLLQREMRRTDRSMKAVLNDALRIGLGAHGKPPRSAKFKVDPHPFGFKPGVDPDRLNQLVDELEVEELARKLRQ
jgi:hypothetical protein